MFCCGEIPVAVEENPLIVDVEQILADRAWANFKYSQGRLRRRFMKKTRFTIEVPQNYFTFEQVGQDINKHHGHNFGIKGPETNTASPVVGSNRNGDKAASATPRELLAGQGVTRREITSPEYVSLDTEFSNDTAEAQTYRFRFEKQRQSEINVSFQKGFTLGGKANFSIGIPLVGEAGVETTMQYQVTKSEGERFVETITMEATSDISVGPNSCYIANVQLEEKPMLADFTVRMRMTMPQGRAPVYIKRKADDQLMFVFNVENLKDIFDGVSCAEFMMGPEGKFNVKQVDFVIKGVLKGSIACNHKIQLKSDESLERKREAQAKHFQ